MKDRSGQITVRLRRGRDVQIAGAPRQVVSGRAPVASVAILGADFPGVRPAFEAAIGDRVATGQTLFRDRRRPAIGFPAPAAGTIVAIDRRPRGFDSVVISVDGVEKSPVRPLAAARTRESVRSFLLETGLWPSFLTRPFGRIPDTTAVPEAIFVTTMDSSPLAADASAVLEGDREAFDAGLDLLVHLTDGTVYVCQAPGPALATEGRERIEVVRFAGPHPAGLPGTHIHCLEPVRAGRVVWHVGCQDVAAMGRMTLTGRWSPARIVALAGPGARAPRLVRTTLGASLSDLTAGETTGGDLRIVSGTPLCGRTARYLGRYHLQVSVLRGPPAGAPIPWLERRLGGGRRATAPMIPLAAFERVLALDIPPVPLLRALATGDAATAERLGCLELAEEDVALASYLCASGADYGRLLRQVLDEIEAAN